MRWLFFPDAIKREKSSTHPTFSFQLEKNTLKINRGRKKPKTLTQIRLGNLLTRRYKVNEDDRSVNFGDLSKCFPVVKNEMKNKKNVCRLNYFD